MDDTSDCKEGTATDSELCIKEVTSESNKDQCPSREYYANGTHCLAPSSSPCSSPISATATAIELKQPVITDVLRSFRRSKTAVQKQNELDLNDRGRWFFMGDLDTCEKALSQVETPESAEGGGETMSTKSELDDVVESAESPRSKLGLDEVGDFPGFAYVKKQPEGLTLNNFPEIPLPSVHHGSPAGRALSNSAPASTAGSSSEKEGPPNRPTQFKMTISPSAQAGLSASGSDENGADETVDYESFTELPTKELKSLIDQMSRTSHSGSTCRWVVPVLKRQELEVLLEIAIQLVKKGLDSQSIYFDEFLEKGLLVAFKKLMCDDAVKEWRFDIHQYIWHNANRFLVLFTEKLRKTSTEDINRSYWLTLDLVLNRYNRFHVQRVTYHIESLNVEFDKDEMVRYTSLAREEDITDITQGWLYLLVTRFGSYGGFELIRNFIESNTDERTTIIQFCDWLRPFSSCAPFLKQGLVWDSLAVAIMGAVDIIRKAKEQDLKCETVKGGDLSEIPHVDLARILVVLLRLKPEMSSVMAEMQKFVLRYVLRVTQVAAFGGRIVALEELIHVANCCAIGNSESVICISMEDFANWLRDNSVIGILLRDNLHHPSYCERLERFFRVLCENDEFRVEELDTLWKSKKNKHDVIQRNCHDIIANLMPSFNEHLRKHLFELMKENWSFSTDRERILLLDLTRRIGTGYIVTDIIKLLTEQHSTEKLMLLLSFLWDLFHDSHLSPAMIDSVLDTHYTVLHKLHYTCNLQKDYMMQCIRELSGNTAYVVPALKHLQRLMLLIPEHDFSSGAKVTRGQRIAELQKETSLCTLVSASVKHYMDQVRHVVSASSSDYPDVEFPTVMIDNRYTHVEQIKARLELLHFVLSEGHLWLMSPLVEELWESLIVKAVFSYERTFAFQLFATMQERYDIDPTALDPFFNEWLLNLSPTVLNQYGLLCFKMFWIAKNKKAGKICQSSEGRLFLNNLELEGIDYLWKIILMADKGVSREAIALWAEIYVNPNPEMFVELRPVYSYVINKCFVMLKGKHEELIRGDISEEQKPSILSHMARILLALQYYIHTCDEEHFHKEKKKLPITKACLGMCSRLTVVIPGDQILKINRCHDSGYPSSVPYAYPNEERVLLVHSNMTLAALRLEVKTVLQKNEKCKNGDGIVPNFDICVCRAGQDKQILERRFMKRTLSDMDIDDDTQLSVQFVRLRRNSNPAWDDDPLSESSCAIDLPPLEEKDESVLPGVSIATNPEQVRFLYTLCEIGFAYGHSVLRDMVTDVINIMPADVISASVVNEMLSAHCLVDLLPVDSPTQSIYRLRVLLSLIMPSSLQLMSTCRQAQRTFFLSPNCLAVFAHLSDSQLLCRWDCYATTVTLFLLTNIAMVVLAVAYRMKVLKKEEQGEDTRYYITDEASVFNNYCYMIAQDMRAQIKENPELEESISRLYSADPLVITLLLRIAWAASTRKLPLVRETVEKTAMKNGDAFWDSSEACIALSQRFDELTISQYQLTVYALKTLSIAVNSDEGVAVLVASRELWCKVLNDILFAKDVYIRANTEDVVRKIICRMGSAARELAVITVKMLLEKNEIPDNTFAKNPEFFSLLCWLLEHCQSNAIEVTGINQHLEKVLDWLDLAKQHTLGHQESYPDDYLLIGRLNTCRSLIAFLSPGEKEKVGSDPNGTQLVKQLLDDFVLPISRAYFEMLRSRQTNDYLTRSVTQQSVRPGSQEVESASIPRSATIGSVTPSRCTPVCGTLNSVKAAYTLLATLCDGVPNNFRAIATSLLEVFYSEAVPVTSFEWDYLPGFALRAPNNYVGLKNGGATCYMNSVLQQIFMIEPIRNAVINTNSGDFSMEEFGDDILTTNMEVKGEGYHVAMFKNIQSVFAHLIGSELQYYSPQFIWDHFRLGDQIINVREQQDALEFFNALVDVIDEGAKKLGDVPICEKFFGGAFSDQKICKGCPHRYSREERFTTISVDIRSHNNLLDSLNEYVKGDLLTSDNAYHCEQCQMKVTAIKRMCLAKLPPYLVIQLKRFDFDWEREIALKFNDYFEFPQEFDMFPYTVQGLAAVEGDFLTGELPKEEQTQSPAMDSGRGTAESVSPEKTDASGILSVINNDSKTAEASSSTRYRLRGVVVHSGQASGGHYYSFIRSEEDGGRWYKFDDVDVTEWQLTTQEMKNTWFGGESDVTYDSGGRPSLVHKDTKRWWNAYLLFFEKIPLSTSSASSVDMSNSCTSLLPSQSSFSASISPLDRKIAAMPISTRIRQLPARLEALIRSKNTLSMHERSQYTVHYFHLIKEVCSRATKMVTSGDFDESICILATKLLSKFLFTTGLRARKNLRAGNMAEWQKIFETLFSYSPQSRAWFVCNILFQHHLVVLYLLRAPSADIRYFFVNVSLSLVRHACNDPTYILDPYKECCVGFQQMGFARGNTVGDLLIALLLVLPRNCFTDLCAQPSHYFLLFWIYAQAGLEQKRRLVRHGALSTFLILSKAESLQRTSYQDTTKLLEIISMLLRVCKISESESLNPYVHRDIVSIDDLVEAPEEVKDYLRSEHTVENLVKRFLEIQHDHSVALETLLYICYDNFVASEILIKQISFETLYSMSEVKFALHLFERMMSLHDSCCYQRRRFAILGDADDLDRWFRGFLATTCSQKYGSGWKTYNMLRMIVRLMIEDDEIFELVRNNEDARDCISELTEWLGRQLGLRTSPSVPLENAIIERTSSALDLYDNCRRMVNLSKEDLRQDEASTSAMEMPHDSSSRSKTPSPNSTTDTQIIDEHRVVLPEKDSFDDDLTVSTSVSVEQKQAESAALPPPPPYSEYDVQENPQASTSDVEQFPLIHKSPKQLPAQSTTGSDTGSHHEFDSTGVEAEDAPPLYDEVLTDSS